MSRTVVHRRTQAAGWLVSLAFLMVTSLAACSDPYEETGPADELEFGELCAPAADDCPSSVRLRRSSALGANRLDFQLTNTGDAPAEITVAALPDDSSPVSDAAVDAADIGDTSTPDEDDTPSVELVARSYALAAGESTADRFVQEALFTQPSFRLQLRCDGCAARVEYALGSEPLECRADDDCSGGWLCRETVGRCVECLSDEDCAETQTCSATDYRCSPDEAAGCAQVPTGRPFDTPLPLTLGALCVLGITFRRRRRLFAGVLTVGCVLTLTSIAHADPPRAAFNVGIGSRFLTGELGEHAKRGIGLNISQELRGEYVGGRVELGASYFLTTQDAPPLSHELEMYSIAFGPQAYIPAGPVQIVVGLDYRHVGLVSNSLIRFTGPEVNHSAAGGSVEVRYRIAPLEVMLRGGYHPIFGLDSSLFAIDLAVGLATN